MDALPVTRRRVLVGAALASIAVAVSACDFESPDETSRERSQVQAANFTTGQVLVRDAFLTTVPYDGLSPAAVPSGTAADPIESTATSETYLVASFVNQGPKADQLTGVSTSSGSLTPVGGDSSGLTLGPGVVVSVGDPDLATSSTTMLRYDPTSGTPPQVGTTVPLTFSFATAGQSQVVQVPVVAPDETTNVTTAVPSTPVASPPGS
jgi:hypothetical protein